MASSSDYLANKMHPKAAALQVLAESIKPGTWIVTPLKSFAPGGRFILSEQGRYAPRPCDGYRIDVLHHGLFSFREDVPTFAAAVQWFADVAFHLGMGIGIGKEA